MAFGTATVLNDPLIALTDGQPEGRAQEREHDRLVLSAEDALRGESETLINDRCQGELRLVWEGDSVWVYQNGSQSAVELCQVGLPLLRRICNAIGA